MDTDAIPAENLAAPDASLSIGSDASLGELRYTGSVLQFNRDEQLVRVVWNFVRTAGVWAESGSGIS